MTLTSREKEEIRDIVKDAIAEQLGAASPASSRSAGESTPDGPESWAYEALSGEDIARSQTEQLSPSALARKKTGVDPTDCDSRAEFVRKVDSAEAGVGGD